TGISSGGAYEVTERTIRMLKDQGFPEATADRLAEDTYKIDAAGIAAVEAEYGKAFAQEIEASLSGKSFAGRRDLERELKRLKERPRSTRDLKKAADLFKRSILNTRVETEEAFMTGIGELGHGLPESETDQLARTAYTGWVWTTENYSLIASLPSSLRAAGNTLIYVSLTLSFNLGFGLFLAVTTFYLPAAAATTFRTIWFLPRILPPVIYVMMWKWMAWDTGFLSSFLANFGVPPRNWMLHSDINAWVVVILINGFVGASLGMILFSSAIKAIPETMLHASEVDGANRLQQIRYIILPQLRWPILFTTAYQTLSLLTSFDYIYLSTDGGPGKATEVWALYTFHTALNNYGGVLQYGLGAALAMVLVVIGIAASLIYLRLFNFNELVAKPRIEQ
ncbi:MAG: sugar ABC transporter permease, partial [Pseudomonadota bacterium]|nr:sugar ABC transporter permease [Pseudomonadota bacterium]